MSAKDPKRRLDGRLQRQVTVINQITNEKITKRIYGRSKRELNAQEDALRSKYSQVVYNEYTLYNYLSLYVKERKAELEGIDGLSTVEQYERYFDNYIKDTRIGNTPLSDLNVFMLREFFLNWKPIKSHFSGGRAKQMLYTELKTALNQAFRDGLIEQNPLDKIAKPRHNTKEKSVVTDEQFLAIIAMAEKKSPQMANLFRLDINSGLRRGEIVGLRFTDIDFDAGTVNIVNSIKKTKKFGQAPGSTKNFTSRRKLLLDKVSLDVLRSQLAIVKESYKKAKRPFNMNSYVFESLPGRHYSLDHVTWTFRKIRNALGYPETMTLHSLRHTAATFLAEHDVGTRKLMVRFGWSTGKMADRYTHETEKMQEDVVDILNGKDKRKGEHSRKVSESKSESN